MFAGFWGWGLGLVVAWGLVPQAAMVISLCLAIADMVSCLYK